jgi:hypothetical protein
MKKKLILLAGSLLAIAAVITTIVATNSNDEKSLLMQNVEALAALEGDWIMGPYYTPLPYSCTIRAGASGKVKIFGGDGNGVLSLGVGGEITIDGARDCEAEGKISCAPVACSDLYADIFD